MGFFLNGQQPRAPSLRDLLAGPEPIVAPGAYDAFSARLIEAAGFRIIIFPISTLLAATRGIREVLETIRTDGTPAAALSGLPRFGEFTDFIGLPEIQELEQQFSSLPVQTRS